MSDEDGLNFKALIEHSSDAIVVHDFEGGVLYSNPAALALIGDTSLEEVFKRSVTDHLPHNGAGLAYSGGQKLKEGLELPPFIASLYLLNGNRREVEVHSNIVNFRNCPAVQVHMRDISHRRQVDEIHTEKKEMERSLINFSPIDLNLLIDLKGIIVNVDNNYSRLLGQSPENIIGKCIWNLIPSDRISKRRKCFDQAIREKQIIRFEARVGDKWYDTIINPILSEKGTTAYLSISGRDITDRKRIEKELQQSEDKYRALVEASPDAVLIIQEDTITYANSAAAVLFAAPDEKELIGKSVYSRFGPRDKPKIERAMQEALHGNIPAILKVQILIPDGTARTIEGKGSRVCIGDKPAILVMMRDVTEREIWETQMKEQMESLSQLNRDMEMIAHIATHDLQEPIRGIVTYSQLVMTEWKKGEYTFIEKYLRNIEKSGLRMHELLGDLRTYTTLKAYAQPFRLTNMEEVLSHALDSLMQEMKRTQTTVIHDPLPIALIDRVQVTQVFQNIIGNAIKFRREGIPPEITISVSRQEGMWQFSIQDNGIGIPQAYFDKIFILFERLHGREQYPGTGIGLALCKQIVERHGGTIWVASTVGKGSTFSFTLPKG